MVSLLVTNFVLSFPTRFLGWDLGFSCVSSYEFSYLLLLKLFLCRKDAFSLKEKDV